MIAQYAPGVELVGEAGRDVLVFDLGLFFDVVELLLKSVLTPLRHVRCDMMQYRTSMTSLYRLTMPPHEITACCTHVMS